MNQLNFKEYGREHKGLPIIILHGLLGMLDNWHSFAKALSETKPVICLDQRNHGKSFHSNDFNYKLLSSDLNDFLENQSIDQCHLIGHSMGGKSAMQFQADQPHKVSKSIIVDIAPKEYSGGHEKIFEALLSLDLSKITKRSEAQIALMESLNNLPVVQFLLKNLTRNSEGKFAWKANIKVLYEKYNSIKGSINPTLQILHPTLFVKGSLSDYIQENDQEPIQSIFPNATFKTIENAGHWVHAANPKDLLKSTLDFLKAS